MPYSVDFKKAQRHGCLKLLVEFRNCDNILTNPEEDSIVALIYNPLQASTEVELIKEDTGIYSYEVQPDNDWDYGLYRLDVTADLGDPEPFTDKQYFMVTSNAEFRHNWKIMTPEQIIRDYLVGDIGIDYDTCKKILPETIWWYINVAIEKIERDIQVRLRPVTIASGDVKDLTTNVTQEEAAVDGIVRADVVEAPYDYHALNYQLNWGWMELREYPIIKVERLSFVYPTGQKIMDFPTKWIKPYLRKGQIHLVPTAGTIDQAMVGQSGQWLPLTSGWFLQSIPQLIYVTYTAGMLTVPLVYKDMVAKLTCIELLRITGDAIARGIASASMGIDGLSQSLSFTNTPNTVFYKARIQEYADDWNEFKVSQKQRDKGIQMKVI
jgi:hypothetical protein